MKTTTLHNEEAFKPTDEDFAAFSAAVGRETDTPVAARSIDETDEEFSERYCLAMQENHEKIVQERMNNPTRLANLNRNNKVNNKEEATNTDIEIDPRELPFMLNIALKERDESNTRLTASKARVAFYEKYIDTIRKKLAEKNIDLEALIQGKDSQKTDSES